MPRSSATQHELQRCGLLSGLPGETLGRLAKLMEREEVGPGRLDLRPDHVYIVFAGMLSGSTGVLRPGDSFDGSLGAVTAMTPCVVASCERAAFDELVRS